MDWSEPEQPNTPQPARSPGRLAGSTARCCPGGTSSAGRVGRRRPGRRRAVLAACGTTSTSSSASQARRKPTGNRKKIGFSQPDTSASIWAPLMPGAQQECQARGYELLESHANSQLDAQLSEIQTWIAEGVGAIVALPLDNNAIIPLINSAHARA